jgi:hypothetical protein
MKAQYTLFLKLIGSLFALALLAAPTLAVAAITITQVDVVIGNQHFCDTSTSCGNQIWTLPGGSVTLNPGETLILTQTGTMTDILGGTTGGNFDTSDRGPQLSSCTSVDPCNVQVFLNIDGGGLVSVYNSAAAVPLNNFNIEPSSSPSPSHNEAAVWQTEVTTSTYTLAFGYADNEHTDACAGAGGTCFPQTTPFGTGGATFFIGAGLAPTPSREACGDATHPIAPPPGDGCYDAGALLITALTPPPPPVCPLTQGFWKTHPDAWPVPTLTIGGITYTEAQLLTVLNTATGGDAVLILADQLIAALLNVASGTPTTPAVAAAIADAQTLLTGINLLSHTAVKTSSTLGQKMVNDATILNDFNNAAFSPGCAV